MTSTALEHAQAVRGAPRPRRQASPTAPRPLGFHGRPAPDTA